MELGELVRKYREAHRLSQAELGRAVGVSQATIDKIESGKTTLSRFLPRIAARLGIPQRDLDPLIGAQRHEGLREPGATADDDRPPAPDARFEAERGRQDERTLDREDAQRRSRVWSARTERAETDLPVYIANADAFPIDWIKRPPPLANVRNAYGLLVKDPAMEPEFWPGDIALVHPHLPPSPQSACVFRTDSPPDAERSQLAHLVSFDSAAWHVRQWHPPSGGGGKFTLSRKEWPVCHRVVGKYSRG
jgi:transcriptional regulator with XRE-family HTH domain